MLTASLLNRTGAAADPKGKAGLNELASSVITQGTTTRSATEIAQAVEALGASLNSGAGWDESSLSLTVKADQADAALAIVADVARNPAFAEPEVERQRAIAIDNVSVSMKDPGTLSRLVAARALYGDTAYAHPADGTLESLPTIGRDDLLAAYRRAWTPANTTLILTGDIAPDAGARARRAAFRKLGRRKRGPPRIRGGRRMPGPR